jgi:glutamyl-tRNA synthetase
LHIGGLRAAIFNWLFARHYNGVFLLRIEDTDKERSEQQYTDAIIDTFAWMGMDSDEPIVVQSERIGEHMQVIARLIDEHKAYYCSCTQEEVLERHIALGGDPLFVKYDGRCREHGADEHKPHVVRFAIPASIETISFNDMIRGPIVVPSSELDDFIIARSDGTPMYNFVVVVDDAFMGITHVIRGEDHISNTPKQILLYEACGYALPEFAHAPNILGPSGKKLSKREAATSVLDYRQSGYLPQALCNYLVRLGWSHGDQELFSTAELIQYFTLDAVGKKGSIFDPEKLEWLNALYIRAADPSDLLARITTDVDPLFESRLHEWTEAQMLQGISLYQDRVKTLKELVRMLESLYHGPSDEALRTHAFGDDTAVVEQRLRVTHDALEQQSDFTSHGLKTVLNTIAKQCGVTLVSIAQPLRFALTGHSDGPGVMATLAFVGKEESLLRIARAIDRLR